MRTPPTPRTRGAAGVNLVLGLLAGLMILLSVPVLVETSGAGLSRLALLALLVVLPATALFLVQRRSGGPTVPEVTGRRG